MKTKEIQKWSKESLSQLSGNSQDVGGRRQEVTINPTMAWMYNYKLWQLTKINEHPQFTLVQGTVTHNNISK